MKNRLAYTIVSFAALLFLANACSQEEIELYSGCKAGIYIQQTYTTDVYGNPLSYRDSVTFSFANYVETTTQYGISFYVRTMGDVADYDRPYKVRIVPEKTTATEGEDFTLEGNSFTIKAGESSDRVVVYLKRTPKLRQTTLSVTIGIEPNEHFEVPIETYKNSSSWSVDGPTNSATTYKINFNERYTQPSYWGYFGDAYFGAFSVAKYLELNKVMGWTVSDWSNAGSGKVVLGRFDFAAKAFQKHLQAMADAGTPVLDDDGSYMQLPDKYAVNYQGLME